MAAAHLPLGPPRRVVAALEEAGLQPTLGGSGLLLAHGLVDRVRDWDLLVDAEMAVVTSALRSAGLTWIDAAADRTGPYATTARLVLAINSVEIDLMVGFAIWPEGVAGPGGPVRIPSLPAGRWNGIRLGSLEAWLVAYRLMARPGKPALIHGHLAASGVNHQHLERLLAEPLPAAIRRELEDFRHG